MTTLALLTNGSGTSPEATWPGGGGVFMVAGQMPRGLVKLQFLAPDNVTWVDVGDRTNLSATGAGRFDLPAGVKVRAVCDKRPVNGVDPATVSATVGTLTDAVGPDRELAVVTYLAKTASSGVAVGDTITLTQVVDLSQAIPVTVAVVWRNQTTALDLAGPPPAANLTISGAGGLTNAELRAAALAVSGPVTDAQMRAAALPVTGPATDAQMRATPLPTAPSGTKIDAAAALGAGGVGDVGWWSSIWLAIQNLRAQFPASTGIKASGASLSTVPASDANVAREIYTVTPLSLIVNGGANFVAFAPVACTQFDLVNLTGVPIEYRRGAGTVYVPIPDGGQRLIQGITSSDQISVRRVDQSATAVSVAGEAFA